MADELERLRAARFARRDRVLGWVLRVLTHATAFVLGLLAGSVTFGG